MTRTQAIRKARRITGLARFERECKTDTMSGIKTKAYKIPGSISAGKWEMLRSATFSLYKKILSENSIL